MYLKWLQIYEITKQIHQLNDLLTSSGLMTKNHNKNEIFAVLSGMFLQIIMRNESTPVSKTLFLRYTTELESDSIKHYVAININRH